MAVTVRTGPISAQDNPADIPKEKWQRLVDARCAFAKVRLPYDCTELLRFVKEMREFDMVAALGYADEDDFIRRGLELDPETVHDALVMLERMKPEWAIPLRAAAKIGRTLGKNGGIRQSGNTRLTLGKQNSAAYIRARLERDGLTNELAAIDRGETTANAVAIKLKWRAAMVQHAATVEGFTRAILSHLSPLEQAQVIDGIGRPLAVAPTKKRRAI